MIHVGFISTLGRLREVDPAQVKALAESIKEVGLINPITVYPRDIIRNGQTVEGYGLVAGAHRLEACKSLGWSEVPVVVVDLNDNDRIIAECDENLCGSRLSPAEKAEFTAARKKAYLAKHPETALGQNQHTRVSQDGEPTAPRFTADTAAKTGRSETSVQRDVERGEKVTPAALAMVKGTKLDTGEYLDKLKKIKPENQCAKVQQDLDALRKPKPKSAAPHAPDPEDDYSVRERQVSALMNAWNKAGKEAREHFIERIGASL